MHTFLIILAVIICVAAVVLVVCHFNDDNMTPVGKTAASVFIAAVALVVSLQVMLDYPDQTDYLVPRVASATSAEQYAGQVERRQSVAPVELPAQVVEAPRPAAVPGVAPGVASVAAAPVVVQAPREDSTLKDMALGGALGYLAGSAGRGSDTRSVTNHTTVIHEAPPSYSPPSPPPAARYTPPPRPATAAAPSFKSTFSMTRSGRR